MNKIQTVEKLSERKEKKGFGHILSDLSMPILLVLLIVFFSLMTPAFFTQLNLTNILVQNVHVAVCTTGVFIIMISGGCDLSIGYQMAVAAVLVAKAITTGALSIPMAIILGIILCMLLGTFNGVMSQLLKSHTMIVTLATMAVFQGIAYLITNSKNIHNLFGWLPLNIVIAVVVIVIAGVIMAKTSIGRKVYAAGDNPEAARLAGLSVVKIKILAFTFAGLLVGIAAVLFSARNGYANAATGSGIEFTGITACVLAGVALKGGEGTLWKSIVAVYVLGVLTNGMQLLGLGTYPQYIAKGVLMLLSLYLSNRNAKTA